MSLLRLLQDIGRGYKKDDCPQHAAVISFYSIFSLIPLAMLAITILTMFVGHIDEILAKLSPLVESVLPNARDAMHEIFARVISKRQQISFFSASILIIVSSFLVSSLERALDSVFRIEKRRNFFHSKLLAVGFVFVFILLFAAPGIINLVQEAIMASGIWGFDAAWTISTQPVFFMIAFVAFLVAVIVIPHHKVMVRYALCGGVAFTLLTGIARLIFRYYISISWSRYDFIYDSLSVLIILMLWVYYVVSIFLLCAEFVARLQESANASSSG